MDAILWALLKNEVNKSSSAGGSTYQPFDPSWTTNSTTADFCEDIMSDKNVAPSMAYMGEVTLSDMPFHGNAEVVAEIMEGPASGPGKSVHLILTSGTDAPYHWEYTYWKTGSTPHMSGWIGFQPYSNLISFRIAMVNTDDTYTAYAEDGMTWAEWCSSDYNVMYYENGNIIPDSKGAWQYDTETGTVYLGDNVTLLTQVGHDCLTGYYYPYIIDSLLYYTYYHSFE